MYQYIVNPTTNRKVNINSKLGKKILNKYINLIGGNWEEDFSKESKKWKHQGDPCMIGTVCGKDRYGLALTCARTEGNKCMTSETYQSGERITKYPHVTPLHPSGTCQFEHESCYCVAGHCVN